jgi:hypothetical protein
LSGECPGRFRFRHGRSFLAAIVPPADELKQKNLDRRLFLE